MRCPTLDAAALLAIALSGCGGETPSALADATVHDHVHGDDAASDVAATDATSATDASADAARSTDVR